MWVLRTLYVLCSLCTAYGKHGFLQVSSLTEVEAERITTANGHLYLTSETARVKVLNAGPKYKTKPNPRIVAHLNTTEGALHVHHTQYHTYVTQDYGVAIYSAKRPFKKKAYLSVANAVLAASVDDKYLYVFCTTGNPVETLAILFDTEAITAPEETERLILKKGRVVQATVTRGAVFAGTSEAYIMVLDPSNKEAKYQLRSSTSTARVPSAITSFLEFLYVGIGNTMRVYLCAMSEMVQEMAKVKFDYPVVDLQWFGGNIYVVTERRLHVICVMDPVKPFQIGVTDLDSQPKSIAVLNDTAWIVNTADELFSMPAVPPPLEDADAKDSMTVYTPTPKLERSSIIAFPHAEFEPVETRSGMPAWQYILGSRFSHIPDFMISSTILTAGRSLTFVPKHRFKAGTQLKVKCKDRMCNVFVHVEHCTPCSTQTNGGLPGLLIAEGWHTTTCAPTFTLSPTGTEHKMLTFRKQFRVNETKEIATLTHDGVFVGVTVAEGREMCEEITKQNECDVGSVMCAWDYTTGACMPHIPDEVCRDDVAKYNAGQCRTCARHELADIVQRAEADLALERELAEEEEKERKVGDTTAMRRTKKKLKALRERREEQLRELEGAE